MGELSCLNDVMAAIPKDAPVIVSDPLAARMVHRRWIRMPSYEEDQTEGEWLAIRDPKFKDVGLVGSRKVTPWKKVYEGCEFTVYRRE